MLLQHEETTAQIVGLALRRMRLSLGMTQADLARRCGITHQQLHKYEQARSAVSTVRLITLARALGVLPSALVQEVETRLEAPSDITAPATERQTLQLVAAFEGIANDEAKRNLVRLVRDMARAWPAPATATAPPVTLAGTAADPE